MMSRITKHVKTNTTLEQTMKAQMAIQYNPFNFGARCGWMANVTLRPLYPLGRDSVPIIQKAR
jgi:hypothetical protein